MKTKNRLINVHFIWLIIGCACLLFMGGKWNMTIAVWTGSVFFVRYFRQQESNWGFLLAAPFILAASHVFFIGLAEQVTFQFKILIAVSYTLYIMIPCLVDRALHHRIKNALLSSLVYPSALIVVQFLLSYIEQLGTVLNWTVSLFSMKPVIQLVSVTGVWGPSFLVGWLAAVINALWEEKLDLKRTRVPVLAFTGVFAAVMLFGGIRTVFFPPTPGTVKVGSVVVGLPEDNIFYKYIDSWTAEEQQKNKEQFRKYTVDVQEQLFEESEGLIPSGIKILSWPSGNAGVFEDDEAALIKRMQAFAEKHGIYFFPSILVLGDYSGPDRNKVLAITPDGEIAYTHYKGRNPNAGYFEGNAIQFIDTPFGRIASPICFEMEFHRYISQVGKNDVDILIIPGDEPSKDNTVVHTEVSSFRALENGCSMLRTTLEGLTMGLDYQGRVLSQLNFYTTLDSRSVITELPVKGVHTVYTAFGDWFAYACFILLGLECVLAARIKARTKSV